MSKLLMAAFAAAILMSSAPSRAQASPESSYPRVKDPQAVIAWAGRVVEAINIQAAAMNRLNQARPLMESMTTPAGLRAGAGRMREILAQTRLEIDRSDRALAAIAPVEFVVGNGLTPERMLADARGVNANARSLLGDYDAYLAAAERGDQASLARLRPKLAEGSFLMIEGSASIMRNRQAAFPPTQSIHQTLGISIHLSRSMAAAGRAWLLARNPGNAEAAAARLREQLGEAALQIRAASRTGRENLAREQAQIDALIAKAPLSPEERISVDRIRAGFAAKEKMFAVGDELATVLEADAGIAGPRLAAQPTPQLLGKLADLEMKLQAINAQHAALATAPR